MADLFSPRQRSSIMRAVKGKDTSPERIVRRMAHALGYRFRLHVSALPGCPDMVFPCRRKVIFVHGCFWHKHRCKRGDRMPVQNREYWLKKLDANRRRDRRHRAALAKLGYRVLVVWECQIRSPRRLESALRTFLEEEARLR
jgi:DNA mismatch endonuclease (patch repair protein)